MKFQPGARGSRLLSTARVSRPGRRTAAGKEKPYPNRKSAASDRQPCGRQTVGLLGRRAVGAAEKVGIGKEADELEQVETGLIDDLEDVQMVYERDRSRELCDQLRAMSVKEAMAFTGLSRRQVFYLRSW